MSKFLDKLKDSDIFKAAPEKNSIGIDVGSYSVKMVELAKEKEKLIIKNLAYKRIDTLPKEELAGVLRELTESAGITSKEVNTAVSGPSVVIRLVELPRMSKEELRNAIPFEAEKYIPFSIDEVALDHQMLQPKIMLWYWG